MEDLKLHCRLHREPDTNKAFLCQQAVAMRFASSVEISSDGQVAPSTRLNTGSVGSAAKRACMCCALTLQPSSGW